MKPTCMIQVYSWSTIFINIDTCDYQTWRTLADNLDEVTGRWRIIDNSKIQVEVIHRRWVLFGWMAESIKKTQFFKLKEKLVWYDESEIRIVTIEENQCGQCQYL